MSLSCVSKRMMAERLNWQGRAEAVLKCRRLIITFGGCILSRFPCLEVQKLFYNVFVSFLPLKDVLCVPLLCLEEDDGQVVELAGESRSCLKCCRFIFTFEGCTLCPSPVSRRG